MASPVVERLAVFIDGENMSADLFDEISERANLLGECVIWKVFGDLSNNGHAEWLGVCRKHGLQPMIELPLESGKNSTDIAIVIAAMDLLLSSAVNALALASDDRDFIPLVRRLRAGGMNVHGIGRKAENAGLYRFHTTWTQLASKAVPRIDAHKIEIRTPVPVAKTAPAPVSKPNGTLPVPKPDPLVVEFGRLVLAKLAEGALTLSSVGSWIRQEHKNLIPLLGPGKLKKLLVGDKRFKVDGVSVCLAK